MALDYRAIATNGYWPETNSEINNRVVSLGYLYDLGYEVSVGGITDSGGSDYKDSTGDVIYDSLGSPDLLGFRSILTYGYWNVNGSELNTRVATFGYLGSFGGFPGYVYNQIAKSWVALNSSFRMR